MPHLAVNAALGWHVSVNGGAVEVSLKDPRNRGIIYAEMRYRITLAEETAAGKFEIVPVRDKELEELRQNIEAWLVEDDVDRDDVDERPDFETF
ncbi:hypothetical protein HMPREF9710_00792 [Massilia timonae CCUG 45783]|uniref:Uncharacterized protein n=2 Tax=Massilia timonae TaxID=47229 RepID=K9DHB4_9BURK|nr:hypothetical protein HMPREF9710_00792 [Massilia timonae CCUG 45783]